MAKEPAPPSGEHACRECGCARITLVSEAEMVTIYKCPSCGHLSAPVKGR